MPQRILKTAIAILILCPSLIVLSQSGGGSIDGVVVRLGTSEPLSGLNIELRRVEGTADSPLLPKVFPSGEFSLGAIVAPNSPNPGDSFFATTGSDGRFLISTLKPGKYRLFAAHPGGLYYPAEFGQRNPRGPGYPFELQGNQPNRVRMEMAPMASVSGRVVGIDAKPAAHVHVFAAEIAYQNGERILNQIQGADSDDRGNYRLFWLPPGKYVIGAFPEGLRRRQVAAPFGPPAAVEGLNQTYDQAFIEYEANANGEITEHVYKTVYFPGDVNPTNARVLDLRLGSSENGIDISVAPGRQRAVRIRGTVIDSVSGKPAANATVSAVYRSNDPIKVNPTIKTDKDGVYTLNGLITGDYDIIATVPAENNTRRVAVQRLNIQTSNINGFTLTATNGSELNGQIRIDSGSVNGFRVGFGPEFQELPGPAIGAIPADVFTVRRLQPGNYRVSISRPDSYPPSLYVKSIQMGRTEAVGGIVHVDGSTTGPLEIMLGRNGGTIEGRVADSLRQSAANVMVILIPEFGMRPDLFKTASTDATGAFRIQGIAPGGYLAYAWSWVPNGIWQNPEFLRSVERQGQRLTISDGAMTELSLQLLADPD